MGRPLWIALLAVLVSIGAVFAADETSTSDKLRILYSNRFTFTEDGTPLVTVEIMGGQKSLTFSAKGGLLVRPDGEGGSTVRASADRWTISIENGKAAVVKEWTVVARHPGDAERQVRDDLKRWTERGYKPRVFEIGTIFGVEGEVIDSRQTLIAVAPVARGRGASKARAIKRKHSVETTVHRELISRPEGTIVAKGGGVEIRNPSVIWFAAAKPTSTVTVKDVLIGTGGSQLSSSRVDRRYFGAVYAAVGADGKLTAVNAIAGDQLLAGLVPSETFPEAAMEALKAQAVAARTILLEMIGTRHLGDPFLLCSTQHCQVYSGAGKEHPRTTKAVKDTRGMVLMSEGGELVDARYSASCGGHSEDKDFIWGGDADSHLHGHLDSEDGKFAKAFADGVNDDNVSSFLADTSGGFCAGTKYSKNRYRWEKSLTTKELTTRIAKKYPQVGTLRSLKPLKRGRSGRISELEMVGSRGKAVARGDLHIRRLLGGLRSSLFTVKKKGASFAFKGAGFGHGVGMCQVGAIGMAEKRNSFREILYHYYTGSKLRRLY